MTNIQKLEKKFNDGEVLSAEETQELKSFLELKVKKNEENKEIKKIQKQITKSEEEDAKEDADDVNKDQEEESEEGANEEVVEKNVAPVEKVEKAKAKEIIPTIQKRASAGALIKSVDTNLNTDQIASKMFLKALDSGTFYNGKVSVDISKTIGMENLVKKGINSLETAGTGNTTVNSSIQAELLGLAFKDTFNEYGLGTQVTNFPTNKIAGSYVSTNVGVATIQNNVTEGQDTETSDNSPTVTSSTAIMQKDKITIKFTRESDVNSNGNLIQTLRASIAEALNKHKDDAIITQLTAGSSGVKKYSLGSATDSFTQFTDLQTFKAQVKGGAGRKIVASQGALDILTGVKEDGATGAYLHRFTSFDPVTLNGTQIVTSDSLASGTDVTGTLTATNYPMLFGDVRRGITYYANPRIHMGIEYQQAIDSYVMYLYFDRGIGLNNPGELIMLAGAGTKGAVTKF